MDDYDVELPGFRFHPTEEELLDFYLKNMVFGKKLHYDVIGFLNIYHHDPWDLPGLAKIGEREWYFFVPRDRKHGSGGRPNRITKNGFWKATGTDRKILSLSNPKKMIGLKKTLVFYTGRAPRGCKTDWVMNEYRLPDHHDHDTSSTTAPPPVESPMMQGAAVVLCKIYRKATPIRVLEQRAAVDVDQQEMKALLIHDAYYASCKGTGGPICNIQLDDQMSFAITQMNDHLKKEDEELSSGLVAVLDNKHNTTSTTDEDDDNVEDDKNCLRLPTTSTIGLKAKELAEIQVPKLSMEEWTQDPFWTQLRSPWLDNLTTTPSNYYPYANVLNY
ncbi:hypothetical protein ACH5RR_021853 [Cinchona calisaya]|uniref:NAC domain-containing protein n=1 Tax=Cinchona calisaya TaxID=153742 RepID=A0ABD2Z637_9GENT